jgi:hypothetical protein
MMIDGRRRSITPLSRIHLISMKRKRERRKRERERRKKERERRKERAASRVSEKI